MGSRLLLPVLLFAIAGLAAGVYFVSRGAQERTAVAEAPGGAPRTSEEGRVAPEDLEDVEGAAERTPSRSAPDRTTVALEPTAPEESPKDSAFLVRGRVVDEDGRGVAGAMVQSAPHGLFGIDLSGSGAAHSSFTMTETDGSFTLEGLEPGTAHLAVAAGGFAPFRREVGLANSGSEAVLEPFRLTRGALLSGVVRGPEGQPLADARLFVEARNAGLFVSSRRMRPDVTTDANGNFRIDKLACGKWSVRVEHDEHPTRTFEGLADRPGVETSGLEFVLSTGATIRGRIVDAPLEELGGMFVSAVPDRTGDFATLAAMQDSRRAEVEQDGSFLVEGAEPGVEYTLEARSEERDSSVWMFGGRSRSNQVRARAGDEGVVLRFQSAATVAFRVLDAQTREPITDFTVDYGSDFLTPLQEDGRVLQEHPDGMARIDRVRLPSDDQRLTIEIRSVGYETFRREGIAVVPGELADLGRIFLQPVPVLTVTVGDRATGTPIAGARVTLKEPAQAGSFTVQHRVSIGGDEGDEVTFGTGEPTALTDENGVAVLSLPSGPTTLRVTADGYAAFELPDQVFPAGKDAEREVLLSLGGTVLVRTLEPDGTPRSGAKVEHRSPGEIANGSFSFSSMGSGQVSDAEGTLAFENLEPGRHAFRIDEGDSGGAFFAGQSMVQIAGMGDEADDSWVEVEVLEGETVPLELFASPVGTLRGEVSEAGVALPGASLSLVEESQRDSPMAGLSLPGMSGGPSAQTDGRGRYVFEGVKEGRYLLKVEHPTRHMPEEYGVVVRAGESRYDVDLPLTIIEGRITGDDGKPLAGLRVSAERAAEQGRAQSFVMMVDTGGGDTVVSGGSDLNASEVYTDDDGRYSLRGVSSGVPLFVQAEGAMVQQGRSQELELSEGEVRDGVNLQCERAGTVRVEAQLADGSPARFCTVRGTYEGPDAEGVEPAFTFLQSGAAVLEGLKPGPWSIQVERRGPGAPEDGTPATKSVEVVSGEELNEVFLVE